MPSKMSCLISYGFIMVFVLYSHEQLVTGTVSSVSISGPSIVYEGDSAIFTCSATCTNGTCSYSWSGAGSGSSRNVTITGTRSKPSITCTVNDADNSDSAQKNFNVYYGPENVQVTPVALNVTEDLTIPITVSCSSSTCNPSCNATWTIGSSVVREMSSSTISMPLFTSSQKAIRDQDGTYTCTVEHGTNAALSGTATFKLTVLYGPDSVSISPSSRHTLNEGTPLDTTSINCQTATCNPGCSIRWTGPDDFNKDGTTTSLNLFSGSGKLLRQQAGTYTCTVINTETNLQKTNTTEVVVNYPPTVQLTWSSTDSILTCSANGVPATYVFKYVRHFVEGVYVRILSLNTFGNSATQKLRGVTYQDTGVYKCYANNGIPAYETREVDQVGEADVEINDIPVIVQQQDVYNISKGAKLVIEILFYSKPEVTNVSILAVDETCKNGLNETVADGVVPVRFYGTPVNVKGKHLTIATDQVVEENFNTPFTVVVENDEGTATLNFTIEPQGVPDIPLAVIEDDVSYDVINIKVTSGFYNGADQTIGLEYRKSGSGTDWLTGERALVGSEKGVERVLKVKDLEEVTDYEFRVYASNAYGRSNYTSVAIISTTKNWVPIIAPIASLAFVAIIIVVAIVIYRKRKRKDEKPPPPIVPFTNILKSDLSEPDSDDQNAYQNVRPDGNANTQENNYANHEINTPVSKATNHSTEPDPTYMNNQMLSTDSKGYVDFNKRPHVEEAYVVGKVTGSTTAPYYNHTFRPLAETDNTKQKDTVEELDYLEMAAKQQEENIYYNENVKPPQTRQESVVSQDYVEMGKTVNRDSMPNYPAPLPPGDDQSEQEQHYMNTSFMRKS